MTGKNPPWQRVGPLLLVFAAMVFASCDLPLGRRVLVISPADIVRTKAAKTVLAAITETLPPALPLRKPWFQGCLFTCRWWRFHAPRRRRFNRRPLSWILPRRTPPLPQGPPFPVRSLRLLLLPPHPPFATKPLLSNISTQSRAALLHQKRNSPRSGGSRTSAIARGINPIP